MLHYDRHGTLIQKGDIILTGKFRVRKVHKASRKSNHIETVAVGGRAGGSYWRCLYNTKKCTVLN